MKTIALLLALAACAPTYRVITHKCPTTTMLLGDFGLTSVALALAALNYGTGNDAQAYGLAATGGAFMLGANLAETTCRK